MPTFVARYRYTDDTAARDRVRPTHRDFLASQETLLASGPTDDNGAVLVFEAQSAAEVEALLDRDPFADSDILASRTVVGWEIVLGRWSQQG